MNEAPIKKTVYIDLDTHQKLVKLAEDDRRKLGDQVAWLVEQEDARRSPSPCPGASIGAPFEDTSDDDGTGNEPAWEPAGTAAGGAGGSEACQ